MTSRMATEEPFLVGLALQDTPLATTATKKVWDVERPDTAPNAIRPAEKN